MLSNDSISAVTRRSREFHSALASACLPRIDRATVPILGIQDERIVHDRTGVLYRIGDDHFILTAAHQLRGIVRHRIPLYVSVNVPGVLPVPLGDAVFHSTEEEGRDVAAVWLPPDLAQEIAAHKQFLRHNQVNLNRTKSRAPYVFFGYPMGWSGHVVADNNVVSIPLVFSTFEHEGKRDPSAFYDPEVHILFHCTREAVSLQNERNETLPKLKGISGCGIWHVGDLTAGGLKVRSAETLTLIGIQHRWFSNCDYVQATRLAYVLDLIQFHYPRASAAMNLAYAAK